MWVAQTYLGCPDPNAKAFVYYLWEEYKRQRDLPKSLMMKLAELGRAFGADATVLVSMQGSHHEIRSEIRNQRYDHFWGEIGQNTPGLFVTDVPLGEFDPNRNEWAFFPLGRDTINEDAMVEIFGEIQEKCVAMIRAKSEKKKSILQTIYESLELKITFLGAGVNFRPILSRMWGGR
jgi:hypothetical protein